MHVAAFEQVATYHYDIKRVNDQAARTHSASGTGSSLQVRAGLPLLALSLQLVWFRSHPLATHLLTGQGPGGIAGDHALAGCVWHPGV